MNHKKIIRIMKKYNLATRIRRRNPYKDIMKKSLEHRTFENKLNRQFQQNVPFKVFCTDITYLPFNHRFAYLSVVKDVASGEVVASNLSGCLGMDLVIDTVENLKQNKNISKFENILIHSDQGFHYTNPLYIEMVKQLKMTQSMSRKGNCIDNAPIESFFGHLKDDIMELIEEGAAALVYKSSPEKDLATWYRNLDLACEAKEMLSRREQVTLSAEADGQRVAIELTRAKFLELVRSLDQRVRECCERLKTKLGSQRIDRVVLVGGSTRLSFDVGHA